MLKREKKVKKCYVCLNALCIYIRYYIDGYIYVKLYRKIILLVKNHKY